MIDPLAILSAAMPFPWSQPSDSPSYCGEYTRRSIVVSSDVQEVLANVCDDPLPEVGRWSDASGRFWKRFELPCSDWQVGVQTAGPVELTLIGTSIKAQRLVVSLAPALPRPGRDLRWSEDVEGGGEAVLDPQDSVDESVLENAAAVESVTDSHVEFVNDLYDHARPHRHYWEENIDAAALRSVSRSLARWRRCGSRDQARLALIVKLARELPIVLRDVCRRPRMVLRRVREMQSVGRVQEVDAACLRWLARQPGRSIVEKAGTRQQVLGIIRIEDADTPENRVVRDLLLRASLECRKYLAEYRRFPNDLRVQQVRRFRSLLRDMLSDSPIRHVSPLVGIARPNYVLQQEHRYAMLWDAYKSLVHKQKQQENIWRWRERTWSECCSIAIWDALRAAGGSGGALRSDVFCRDEPFAGRFLDARTQIGTWEFAPRRRAAVALDWAEGPLIAQHPAVPRGLRMLCPDCVLVSRSKNCEVTASSVLAVWTLLRAPVSNHSFRQAVFGLDRRLTELTATCPLRGIVMVPDSRLGKAEDEAVELSHVKIVRLPVPLTREPGILIDALSQNWDRAC